MKLKHLFKLLLIGTIFWSCNNSTDSTKEKQSFAVASPSFTGGNIIASNTLIEGQTITSTVIISGVNNTTFRKCLFLAGIEVRGPSDGLNILNCKAVGVGRLVDLSQVPLAFTGNNYILKHLRIDTLDMDGGKVLQGGWGAPHELNLFTSGIEFAHFNYHASTYGPVITGTGLFHLNVHDGKIIFTGTATDGGDYSIFSISGGNGVIRNTIRSGGWGWFTRFYGSNVIGDIPEDVYLYNNINLNTSCYGMNDINIGKASMTKYTTGTNVHVFNNTAGNMMDKKFNGTYSNAICLVEEKIAPYTIQCQNNVSFNVQTKGYQGNDYGGNVGGFSGLRPDVLSNNVYYATYTAAGLINDTLCQLLKTSPLIDAGATTIAAIDFGNNKRTVKYEIGAWEYIPNVIPIPPIPCDTVYIKIPVHDTVRIHDTIPRTCPPPRIVVKSIVVHDSQGTGDHGSYQFNDGFIQNF